ncbi:DUF3152 domain-containing protein [Streptomyces meridianus]|uniref:DUF3152 domain-containing protein n=1 Tax=Streptomyces meridianus TaxID=2938945 RepID=A0ABT0X0T8_9ACTN|nr:DUF3152 domain-containing protein [Streptomyces meridianus]MCM2576172.1 DUF3152 domain-containing protein [Streptomyces meridianus]
MEEYAGQAPAEPAPRRAEGGAEPRAGMHRGPGGVEPSSSVRGGHPEQLEPGGGWGAPGPGVPPPAPRAPGGRRRISEPRQEFVDAFDDDVYGTMPIAVREAAEVGRPDGNADAYDRDAYDPGPDAAGADEDGTGDGEPESGDRRRAGIGRGFTGVAAAAVTTVLAVVVAGQVADPRSANRDLPSASEVMGKNGRTTSRSDDRPAGREASPGPVTYDEKMDAKYPFDPDFNGPGTFRAIGGRDPAPGKGSVVRYRVDIEDGMQLDGDLFAEAVHKTLNDDRSWGHGGVRTFERVSSGDADFVITLASPGTTAKWCSRSGLDTTVDNVSCDSASTERVMINAYRWARGARTFGAMMTAYRQMLINHEVGHRLGLNHRACPREGALAPVMMQQTKYLTTNGVTCKPNAWPYPGN